MEIVAPHSSTKPCLIENVRAVFQNLSERATNYRLRLYHEYILHRHYLVVMCRFYNYGLSSIYIYIYVYIMVYTQAWPEKLFVLTVSPLICF